MKIAKYRLHILRVVSLIIPAVVTITLSYNRVLDEYELPLLDFRYKFRPMPKISDKIVIIEVSDDTVKKIGSWPFDRSYHALMVRALDYAGVKQTVFDIFFSGERREHRLRAVEKESDLKAVKSGDEKFAESIEDAGNVYLPYVFTNPKTRELEFPVSNSIKEKLLPAFARAAKGKGHINIIPDKDGKFRVIPPFIKYMGNLYPQIAFLAAVDYLGGSLSSVRKAPSKYLQINNDIRLPLNVHSNILVNIPGKWVDIFRHYSYVDVITSYLSMLEGERSTIDLGELKDTVCFIGISATGLGDSHPTPFENLCPGVALHASLFNSIIQRKFLSRATRPVNIIILIILSFITHIATVRSKQLFSFIYLATIIVLFFLSAVAVFAFFGIWVDIFYPIVVVILYYLWATFNKYIMEKHKREVIEKELEIARDIQESFLPTEKPSVPGIDIEAKMVTARQVGGDLYDFIKISDNRAGVMIGDVSGKGVPAALYMAKAVSVFKTYAREESVSNTLHKMNNRLSVGNRSNLFVTVAYMVFDIAKKSMSYSLGGHSPILMLRKGEEEIQVLDLKEGMPLGIMDESPFEKGTIDIKKGDIFVLYTDGVTEAMNTKHEMFGQERLADIIKRHRNEKAKEILNVIHKAVKRYERKSVQHDDITVVVIKLKIKDK